MGAVIKLRVVSSVAIVVGIWHRRVPFAQPGETPVVARGTASDPAIGGDLIGRVHGVSRV
jgi:hypothetical protein